MAEKLETRFKQRIRPRLERLPNTWLVKVQQASLRGTPDILMCVNGRFVALELKADKKARIDKLQIYTLKQIEKSGGVAIVTYPENWEETYKRLRNIALGEAA